MVGLMAYSDALVIKKLGVIDDDFSERGVADRPNNSKEERPGKCELIRASISKINDADCSSLAKNPRIYC